MILIDRPVECITQCLSGRGVRRGESISTCIWIVASARSGSLPGSRHWYWFCGASHVRYRPSAQRVRASVSTRPATIPGAARSDPPDECGVIGIWRDDTAERTDGRRVGSAVIANQPSGLNLTGQMLSRPLHARSESGFGSRRCEDVDHQRSHVGVHLELRTAEVRSTGVGGEPVPRGICCLLMTMAAARRASCARTSLGARRRHCPLRWSNSLAALSAWTCAPSPERRGEGQSGVWDRHRASSVVRRIKGDELDHVAAGMQGHAEFEGRTP